MRAGVSSQDPRALSEAIRKASRHRDAQRASTSSGEAARLAAGFGRRRGSGALKTRAQADAIDAAANIAPPERDNKRRR